MVGPRPESAYCISTFTATGLELSNTTKYEARSWYAKWGRRVASITRKDTVTSKNRSYDGQKPFLTFESDSTIL
jgi:hypothetical protein